MPRTSPISRMRTSRSPCNACPASHSIATTARDVASPCAGSAADFTRVRLNGLETLSTAAASDSGAAPNRGRGFDFNVFASDLFSSLEVRKTASANTDEGSLGATVDLVTGKPLDYKGRKLAFSAEDAYYENGQSHNPRAAMLVADQWFDNRLGVSLSGAYSKRDSEVDRYKRQAGQSDYLYRSSAYTGGESPARAGFAAPAGTVLTPGFTNAANAAALTGSDPAAYAVLYPGSPFNTAGQFDDTTVRIPSLLNIEQQDLSQERLGLTAALQWNPTEHTMIGLDAVYSKFDQKSDVNQIQSVGLNRNNTSANYNGASLATTVPNRRGLYQTCASQAATSFREGISCGGTESMAGGVFAGYNPAGTGTSFSTNPNNLDTYDYYNNPMSPGYVASPDGVYFVDRLIGRPGVDVLAAHVSPAGNADYLQLRNVDWRSATDSSYFTTQFQQASLTVQQDIGDQLKMDVLFGRSRSTNDNEAYLIEFNRMDSPETFTYDEREHGSMPLINYGFDLANPNNWNLVKGFSVIRSFMKETDNDYQGGHLNFDPSPDRFRECRIRWHAPRIQVQGERGTAPFERSSEPDAGGARCHSRRPRSSLRFRRRARSSRGRSDGVLRAEHRRISRSDRLRLQVRQSNTATSASGISRIPVNQFSVNEYDTSYFVQLNFDFDVFGNRMFGNLRHPQGRHAREVRLASRRTSRRRQPRPASARRRSITYSATICRRMNVAYQITDDIIVRAGWAKVMARPLLANLVAEHHRTDDCNPRREHSARSRSATRTCRRSARRTSTCPSSGISRRAALFSRRAVQERDLQLPADGRPRAGHRCSH